MPGKTLLFLGASCFHAHTWKGGALSMEQRFSDNQEGKEQFALFLQNHRSPAYLLTDIIEEDFRHETVPHLHGGAHTALIQRKFEQYYRNTQFRQALLLQRRKDGRRDDDMLLSGLTNPGLIQPWLNIMLASNTPVAGIYSVPNISAPLAKNIPSNHLLLLSWEKYAGLRQTYFEGKLMRFSRLTPMTSDKSIGETVAVEAARTQQYLKSLGLLPSGQSLSVCIICHADDKPGLEARLENSTDMQYAYLDIQEMGQHIKSKTNFADSDATPLYLHLLAIKPPRSHYAAPAHTHFFQLLQLRRSLYWLSAVLAIGSLLWSTANILEGRWLRDEGESLKLQTDKLSQQTQQIIQGFRSTLASATDMKTAVLLARKLNNYAPPPQTVLDGLSKTLDNFPRIRVDKLAWQASATPDTAPPNGAAVNAPAQVITLSGDLAEFTGDYRDVLDYVERFQQALIKNGHGVTALALPLDISPKGSIAADIGENSGKPANFSLKIVWRPAL